MLTYADVCCMQVRVQRLAALSRGYFFLQVCLFMLTYADVC